MTRPSGAGRVGDYELIDRFAVGGNAEIFRARDVKTGEVVVIKKMRQDDTFDPEKIAGFIREGQLAMMFKHKNLIRGIARGSIGALDYVVMEYVDGVDLGRIFERTSAHDMRISAGFATYVVGEILGGLHEAHELRDDKGEALGLVHRDLKPHNIFIRYDGQVRVGDFGASIMTAREVPDEVVGSPGYLSPEQARSESIDRRTDVFAVGCLLYEMLTGRPAFVTEKKRDAQILKMHQLRNMQPIPPDMPEALALVVEIATAADMRAALHRTEAPPDPGREHEVATFVRRLFEEELTKTRLPGTPLTY